MVSHTHTENLLLQSLIPPALVSLSVLFACHSGHQDLALYSNTHLISIQSFFFRGGGYPGGKVSFYSSLTVADPRILERGRVGLENVLMLLYTYPIFF